MAEAWKLMFAGGNRQEERDDPAPAYRHRDAPPGRDLLRNPNIQRWDVFT
jgi:hypothetical protein